jgi:multidrug efflux pump subunit AcrA (membrane-fusion protein)
MYADVQITTHASADRILVPDDALVFRNDKTYLPLVRNGHLHLAEVTLGRDDGYRVEINGDVQSGDLVVLNVGQAKVRWYVRCKVTGIKSADCARKHLVLSRN